MAELLELNSLPLIVGGSALLLVILLLWVRAKRTANTAAHAQKNQTAKLEKELVKNGKQLLEVRSVVVGLGQKVTEQQDLIQLLTERIVELEHNDNDGRLYSRASKMVQLGAGVNELIEECEIPKAEAELMMSLQNKIAAKGKSSSAPMSQPIPPSRQPQGRRVTDVKSSLNPQKYR